jgi:hypothetical protein
MSDMREQFMRMLMEKSGGDNDENSRKAKQAHKIMREVAAKQGVTLLFAVTDLVDFFNQLRNAKKTPDALALLHARGIAKIAGDLLAYASDGPVSDAALAFHRDISAGLAEMGGQPLYVVARYDAGIQAYINVPANSIDRDVTIAGIKHLVEEFLDDER